MSQHRENAKILKWIPFPIVGQSLTPQDRAFKAKSTRLRRQGRDTERGSELSLRRENGLQAKQESPRTLPSSQRCLRQGFFRQWAPGKCICHMFELDCRNRLQGDENVSTAKYLFSIFIWNSGRMLVQFSIRNQNVPKSDNPALKCSRSMSS